MPGVFLFSKILNESAGISFNLFFGIVNFFWLSFLKDILYNILSVLESRNQFYVPKEYEYNTLMRNILD
jgi:hypothetical protein